MSSDEHAIRDVISTWLKATSAGDINTVVTLMSSDVVFLLPGRPPMKGRDSFIKAFSAGAQQMRMEGVSEVQEIQISGDLAYSWTHLTVTATPLNGGAAIERKGHILTVFRKQSDGKWVLIRDANLMATV